MHTLTLLIRKIMYYYIDIRINTYYNIYIS